MLYVQVIFPVCILKYIDAANILLDAHWFVHKSGPYHFGLVVRTSKNNYAILTRTCTGSSLNTVFVVFVGKCKYIFNA